MNKREVKKKYIQYYTRGVKYLSVRIFKKLSSNKIGVIWSVESAEANRDHVQCR